MLNSRSFISFQFIINNRVIDLSLSVLEALSDHLHRREGIVRDHPIVADGDVELEQVLNARRVAPPNGAFGDIVAARCYSVTYALYGQVRRVQPEVEQGHVVALFLRIL